MRWIKVRTEDGEPLVFEELRDEPPFEEYILGQLWESELRTFVADLTECGFAVSSLTVTIEECTR